MEIVYAGRSHRAAPGETVLAMLLRDGAEVAYSCRRGSCLACVMRATRGEVPPASQIGLKDTLKVLGYFLPCVCVPSGDLALEAPCDSDLYGRATIEAIEPLSSTVSRVVLRGATPLYYHAGQFVNVRRADGVVRSYSLASVPRLDAMLELHVRRMRGGALSGWLCEAARRGEAIDIQGPNGSCFYLPGRPDQPMILIGTGTGLAPLMGIARDALADGHRGPISLYHGSRHADGLYLANALGDLASKHASFRYIGCVSGEAATGDLRAGRADDLALADHANLKDYRVFVCGHPDMVDDFRRRAYLAGARLADIHGDPFDLRDLRSKPRA
jgi:NAD(P)H-flavin reductase